MKSIAVLVTNSLLTEIRINQTVKIIATDEKEADKAGAAVEVSFTNEHNGRTNGGYGVRNNFKLDKNNQYQYTQPAAKELERGNRNEKVT